MIMMVSGIANGLWSNWEWLFIWIFNEFNDGERCSLTVAECIMVAVAQFWKLPLVVNGDYQG